MKLPDFELLKEILLKSQILRIQTIKWTIQLRITDYILSIRLEVDWYEHFLLYLFIFNERKL